MGEIIFVDKDKADLLKAKGYQYLERVTHGTTLYVFYGSHELMNEINSNFSANDFLQKNTVDF